MAKVVLLITTKINGEFVLAGDEIEVSEKIQKSLFAQGLISKEVIEIEEEEIEEEIVETNKKNAKKEETDLLGEGK